MSKSPKATARRGWAQQLARPANAIDRAIAACYGRYAPLFNAYSFAPARSHEYDADHVAAAITSARTLARALTKLELMGRFLSEVFWTRFLAQVDRSPEPPQRPYSLLPRAFKAAQQEWSQPQWLTQALRRYAGKDDTHPGFAERLGALEVAPQLPEPASEPLAITLLGSIALRSIKYCDEAWLAANIAEWRSASR